MARRKQEEENQMNKLEGAMVILLEQLQTNKTPIQVTTTGLDMGPQRLSILAKNIKNNESLLNLHMSRKGVTDVEGQQISMMLNTNKKLRKLELEGNVLGPRSIAEFGRTLKHNETLRYLDLESNQLTAGGQEFWGIYEFVNFLDSNKTLLSLNLANNDLDEKCGQMFREKLENNHTLIDFDFSGNNFSMEDSR